MERKDRGVERTPDVIRHGQLTRRRFLYASGATLAGLGLAACGGSKKPTASASSGATQNLGDRLEVATWPNYHNPDNIKAFEAQTGVKVNLNVFGSTEEMLSKLQIGGTGWDVVVPTQYFIVTFAAGQLLEPLDLSLIPNYDPTQYDQKFLDGVSVPNDPTTTWVIPKNWGTTGFVVQQDLVPGSLTTWKQYWDAPLGKYNNKVILLDHPLDAIGNAMLYFGHDFNSIDPSDLKDVEGMMLNVKPHLFAISSDIQPSVRGGDAWISMAWSGDAAQLHRDMPTVEYVLGQEGGEIWEDNWSVAADAPHRDAAYAFLNFMLDPKIAAKETEFHGYAQVDARATALLPQSIRDDPVVYPTAAQIAPLSFGSNEAVTDPARAEILSRVKSS